MNWAHEIRCARIYSKEDHSHFSEMALSTIWSTAGIQADMGFMISDWLRNAHLRFMSLEIR
jgi:hypothetical protein